MCFWWMNVVLPGLGHLQVAWGTSAQPFVLKSCLIQESGDTSGIFCSPFPQSSPGNTGKWLCFISSCWAGGCWDKVFLGIGVPWEMARPRVPLPSSASCPLLCPYHTRTHLQGANTSSQQISVFVVPVFSCFENHSISLCITCFSSTHLDGTH